MALSLRPSTVRAHTDTSYLSYLLIESLVSPVGLVSLWFGLRIVTKAGFLGPKDDWG